MSSYDKQPLRTTKPRHKLAEPLSGDSSGSGTLAAEDWQRQYLLYNGAEPRCCITNTVVPLQHAPELKGMLAINMSRQKVVGWRAPPWDKERSVHWDWSDADDSCYAIWLQQEGNDIHVSTSLAAEGVRTVARMRDREYWPVREYLRSLTWDKMPRLYYWMNRYLGAERNEFNKLVGKRFMIAAVARAMQPGCKHDCCLVLEGRQARKKSTALRVLAAGHMGPGKEFFSDDITTLGTKDAVQQTNQAWILELAKLEGIHSARQLATMKAYLSRQEDNIRPPDGHGVISYPRQSVFVGSVNESFYLHDSTGNRRFWPVKVGDINIPALTRDRPQLWAESVHRYDAGEIWHLTAQEEAFARVVQADRYKGTRWHEQIKAYIDPREEVTVAEVVAAMLPSGVKPSQKDENDVAEELVHFDWERVRASVADPITGKRQRPNVYRRIAKEDL
jgi:predicted P-loop ATPase